MAPGGNKCPRAPPYLEEVTPELCNPTPHLAQSGCSINIRVNKCQGDGFPWPSLQRTPFLCLLPSLELLPAPHPQPRSLTSNTPTHGGKCQCDKQPEELEHGLRRGSPLALGDEWKHALEAAGGCGEAGVSAREHCIMQPLKGLRGTHRAESCLCPSQAHGLEPPPTLL